MSRYRFHIHTFGCKVNSYDSGLLEKRLQAAGQTRDSGSPDVHVLNTCAVTAEASQEAVRLVRKIKSQAPDSVVVVTGCSAQVDTDKFVDLQGADLIVANSHKGELEVILDRYFAGDRSERVFRSNIFRKEDLEAGGGEESSHTRAFLKIQDGCNSFCTFCVIPYARGRSRSIAVKDLVHRVQELVAGGAQEVVLTGVHIGDYEDPAFPTQEAGPAPHTDSQHARLSDLVAAVLRETEVRRLRLSSLEPIELSPELIALFSNSRLCPHLHMSIQSGSTSVLARMKRKYDAEAVRASLHKISAQVPQAFVAMDVIAGFPGESEDEFLQTYQLLSETPWTRLHVFPYSERPGTRAALLEGSVSPSERANRAQRLRELSLSRFQREALAQTGREKQVLVLQNSKMTADGEQWQALSRDYWPVRLRGENVASHVGKEVSVRVQGYLRNQQTRMEGVLSGELGSP